MKKILVIISIFLLLSCSKKINNVITATDIKTASEKDIETILETKENIFSDNRNDFAGIYLPSLYIEQLMLKKSHILAFYALNEQKRSITNFSDCIVVYDKKNIMYF